MKLCNKCSKSWPDEFNLCPVCGGELVVEQPQLSDTISMGDGNAINGGITVSKDMSSKDDHSTSSSYNTSHSHNHTTNIITENIYNGPIPTKTKEDLIQEKERQFREHCKKVLADGILTHEDRVWLEEQRLLLDLPEDRAQHILKKLRNINKRPTVMTMAQRIQLDNFKKAISGNMIESIKNQMPNIQVIASKIQDEELHYLNYMVLAALEPKEIIRLYDDSIRIEDNYWLTYWTYVAYQKIGNRLKAENVFLELAKWSDCKPHEDIELVAILGHLILKEKEIASEIFVRTITGASSPKLSVLSDIISVILFYDIDDVNKNKLLTQNKFYIEHFLKEFSQLEIDAARVAKEKMLAQKEAEEKALLHAEKTIKEAEEQMRQLAVEYEKFKQESNLLKQERQNFEIESQQKEAELKEKEKKLLVIHNTNIEKQGVLEQQSKSVEEEKQKINNGVKLLADEREKFNREKATAQRELINKEAALKAEREAIEKAKQQYKEISQDAMSWESKKQSLQHTCSELEVRTNELQQVINKLEQLKNQHCANCGAIASPDAVYCRICGTKLSNK